MEKKLCLSGMGVEKEKSQHLRESMFRSAKLQTEFRGYLILGLLQRCVARNRNRRGLLRKGKHPQE